MLLKKKEKKKKNQRHVRGRAGRAGPDDGLGGGFGGDGGRGVYERGFEAGCYECERVRGEVVADLLVADEAMVESRRSSRERTARVLMTDVIACEVICHTCTYLFWTC